MEEVCNYRIDGGGLLEDPGDGGSDITASDGSMPCPISAHQGKTDSWRNSAASSRSELVILPFGLSQLTRSFRISSGY